MGHGPPFGHRGRSIQVEVRRSGVAAAARPLCDVIFGTHDRETANCRGSGHGFYGNVLGTVTHGMWRGSSAAPAPLLHVSSVGYFRRNSDDLSKSEKISGSVSGTTDLPETALFCYLKSPSCSGARSRMRHVSSGQGSCTRSTKTITFSVWDLCARWGR